MSDCWCGSQHPLVGQTIDKHLRVSALEHKNGRLTRLGLRDMRRPTHPMVPPRLTEWRTA